MSAYAYIEKDEVITRIKKDSEQYLKMLNDELEREENNMFFICPQGHVRLDFDDASFSSFDSILYDKSYFLFVLRDITREV